MLGGLARDHHLFLVERSPRPFLYRGKVCPQGAEGFDISPMIPGRTEALVGAAGIEPATPPV
jgi:hypothetical protein